MKQVFSRSLFVVFALSVLLLPTAVHAATYKPLKGDTLYTSLDFNNDGVKDRFKISGYDRSTGNVNFTLNGKSTSVFVARGYAVTYYKYNKTNVFLFVYMHQYGGGTLSIYRYNGSTLKCVKQELGMLERNLFNSAKTAKVTVATSPYHTGNIASFKNSSSDISAEFLVTYKLNPSTHKWTLTSRYADVKKPFSMTYTGSTFKTSSSAVTINKKGLTLKKSQKYQFVRAYFRPYKQNGYTLYEVRLKVKKGSSVGWFVSSTRVPFT